MLTLPIKKKWFNLILSGEKREEYREIKPYYTKRFQKILAPHSPGKNDAQHGKWEDECRAGRYMEKPFTLAFRNGYSSKSPTFEAHVSLSIGAGKPAWGAEPGREYYVLQILDTKNEKHQK